MRKKVQPPQKTFGNFHKKIWNWKFSKSDFFKKWNFSKKMIFQQKNIKQMNFFNSQNISDESVQEKRAALTNQCKDNSWCLTYPSEPSRILWTWPYFIFWDLDMNDNRDAGGLYFLTFQILRILENSRDFFLSCFSLSWFPNVFFVMAKLYFRFKVVDYFQANYQKWRN